MRQKITNAKDGPLIRLGVILLATILFVGVVAAVSGGVFTTGTVVLDATEGPSIEIVQTTESQLELSGPSGNAQTVDVVHSDGSVTFSGPEGSTAVIDSTEIEGDTTRVTDVDSAGGTLSIDPADKFRVQAGGSYSALEFASMTPDDGQVDFSYDSSSSTTLDVILSGSSDTTYLAVGENGLLATAEGEQLAGTGDDTTQLEFDLPAGSENVEIKTSNNPELSNPDPTGDPAISGETVNLSIDVSDDDFSSAEGTEVEVEFYHGSEDDLELVDTRTINENQTVTTEVTPSGGLNEWRAVATDDYDNTAETEVHQFSSPDVLEIRDEETGELIDSETEITVEFFGETAFESRTTTDGQISMSGLPTTETFVATASADGYETRRVVIDSLVRQQSMYLLDDTTESVDNIFKIQDDTGQFSSPETIIYIQRPVEVDGERQLEIVASDYVGSAREVSATLEQGQRYTILVENEEGDRRDLGQYTALAPGDVNVRVQGETISVPQTESFALSAVYQPIDEETNQIRFEYNDPSKLTEQIDLRIYERGNEENVTLDQTYYPGTTGEFGELVVDHELTEDESQQNWVVDYKLHRNNEEITGLESVGRGAYGFDVLPTDWQAVLSVGAMILIATLFSQANVAAGALAVPMSGGVFYLVEWLPGEVAPVAIVLSLTIAVAYNFAVRRSIT